MPSLDMIIGMSMPWNHHAVTAFQGRPICTADSSAHRSTDSVCVSWHFPSNYCPVCFHLILALLGTLPPPSPVGFCSAYWYATPYIWFDNLDPPPPTPCSHQCHPAAPSIGVHRHLIVHPSPWQWTHSLGDRQTIPTKIGQECDLWPVCGDVGANGGQHQSPPISAVCPRRISNPDARTITPQDERS